MFRCDCVVNNCMQTIPLFDHSLYAIEIQNHDNHKSVAMNVIHDLVEKTINCNNNHHISVHQTVPGLQMNNAFDFLVNDSSLSDFLVNRHRSLGLAAERDFNIVNMNALIVPPGGLLKVHDQYGFYNCFYFLHSPANSGMFVIDSNISSRFFELVGVTEQNEFNSHTRAFNMPEKACFILPSFLRAGTTTNTSNDTSVIIQFTLDIVEK